MPRLKTDAEDFRCCLRTLFGALAVEIVDFDTWIRFDAPYTPVTIRGQQEGTNLCSLFTIGAEITKLPVLMNLNVHPCVCRGWTATGFDIWIRFDTDDTLQSRFEGIG